MEDGCREVMCEEVTFSVTVVDVRSQTCTEMIFTTRVIRITFFLKINFYWSLVDLPSVLISGIQQSASVTHTHTSSVQLLGFVSLRPHGLQDARLPCPSPTLRVAQTRVHRISDAIQPLILCCPLLLLPSSSPSIRVFSNESALLHQVAKVLELQLQHQSFQ